MFAEPAQSSACAFESKGSRGRIFMQPFFRDIAQHAQAAALELASYKARVKFDVLQKGALNFASIAYALEFTGTGAKSMPCDL